MTYTVNDIIAMMNDLREKTELSEIAPFINFIKENIENLNEERCIKSMLNDKLSEAALETANNITCHIMAMVNC